MLTQIFSDYSVSWVEFYFHQWLNFLGQNDSIFLSVLQEVVDRLVIRKLENGER